MNNQSPPEKINESPNVSKIGIIRQIIVNQQINIRFSSELKADRYIDR